MGANATSSKQFTEYESVRLLNQLAAHLIDLSEEGVLTPERIDRFVLPACGFKLLYGTERITNEVMEGLYQLALEMHVVEKMEKMQGGEVINFIEGFPSENRAVLHTAVRDFFENPQNSKAAKEAAELAKAEVNKLEQFLPEMERFSNLVVIGIGGSELGPKALYLALEAYQQPGRHVHFIGNVDPDDMIKAFRPLDLKKTAVAVVSKSGSTLETSVNDAFARDIFVKKGLDPKNHFIAITGEGSPMDQPAKYLKAFYIWDWIGGRYSGSSIIGGVILSFACGFSHYWEFLKGAHEMDQNALNKDVKANLPLLAALIGIWNHNFLNIQTTAIIPYSQALWRFPAHLQQLDMESNGKQIDRQGHFVDYKTGPIIWGEAGTNAQHSFYQLIHQGTVPICLEMIGFLHNQTGEDFTYQDTTSQEKLLSNMLAQAIALAAGQKNSNPNKVFLGNRPSSILFGEKLTPFALGALLAYFEHKTAFQGFIWNINSFDQEGVQLGKVLANKIIDRFKAARGAQTAPFPLADALLKQIRK
jgi:glucose-6-phosphate isomerase